VVWIGVSLQEGLLQLELLLVLGERKRHLFFLSTHLYPFLNVVGCFWMLDVLILASLFGYPWTGSFMFST
jgi:hypothetical protein